MLREAAEKARCWAQNLCEGAGASLGRLICVNPDDEGQGMRRRYEMDFCESIKMSDENVSSDNAPLPSLHDITPKKITVSAEAVFVWEIV